MWFAERRRAVFAVAGIFVLAGLSFAVSGASGASDDPDTLRRVAWTIGDVSFNNTQLKIYSGITSFLEESDVDGIKSTRVVSWSDANCSRALSSDACNDCKHEIDGLLTTVITACIVYLFPVLVVVNVLRTGEFPRCSKGTEMVVVLLNFFSLLFPLIAYERDCRQGLPEHVGSATLEWRIGPGYALMLLAALTWGVWWITVVFTPASKDGAHAGEGDVKMDDAPGDSELGVGGESHT